MGAGLGDPGADPVPVGRPESVRDNAMGFPGLGIAQVTMQRKYLPAQSSEPFPDRHLMQTRLGMADIEAEAQAIDGRRDALGKPSEMSGHRAEGHGLPL